MQGHHSGVSYRHHPEYRDTDQAGKETDEGGEERPLNDSGKGALAAHHVLSLSSVEPSDDERLHGTVVAAGAGDIGLPVPWPVWATGPKGLTPWVFPCRFQ